MIFWGYTTQDQNRGSDIMFNEDIMKLLNEYRSGVAFDISRKSTGVTVWYNGLLSLYRIVTPYKYSKKDPFWEAKMVRSFRKDIKGIIEGKEFDIVVIENTINGCNAITNKELILLNTVPDQLILDGVAKLNGNLYRIEASKWRKNLGELGYLSKEKDKKKATEETLKSYGFRYVLEHENDTENTKRNSGYYDICDSTGILLGGMRLDKERR